MKPLTQEQELLIQHLVSGKSIPEAAQLLGISARTASRWLALPHVAEAYGAVRKDVAEHVREQIKALSTEAIKALKESLKSEAPAVKLKASMVVLDRVAPADAPLQGGEQQAEKNALLNLLTREELDDYGRSEKNLERLLNVARQRRDDNEKVSQIRSVK